MSRNTNHSEVYINKKCDDCDECNDSRLNPTALSPICIQETLAAKKPENLSEPCVHSKADSLRYQLSE
jgi:hypothetical protein